MWTIWFLCIDFELAALNPYLKDFESLSVTCLVQPSHFMITDKISTRYLICTVHIFVSCPNVFDTWIRQLEIRNPLITIDVPLGSNSANLDFSVKVDLQPVVVAVRDFRTPAIASSIVQTSVVRSTAAVIGCGIRRSCHLVIRNYSRRRDTNRIVKAIYFWSILMKHNLKARQINTVNAVPGFFSTAVCHEIYNTRGTVSHWDIQIPRKELKIPREAEYFYEIRGIR